jgi:hypothetical protein
MRLPNPGAFAMRPVLPSETRALLPGDLPRAREIAAKGTALVGDRDSYVARHDIDPGFAYPQANWGDGANNAFRGLFDRVRRCDDEAIGQFRAFCQPFTGFRLYEMTIAGEPPDDLSGYTDARIALNLERNLPYVDQWLSLPRHHVFVPPRRFGEIGHDIDGVIVNYDTWAYQERIDLLHDSGALDRLSPTARVLEIGGGYGALGYWFKQAYPGCAYTIIDLPECLLFSGLYLGLSDVAFRAVPNYAADALQEPFDLVINTLSMSEMSAEQVRHYTGLMRKYWLSEGGVFFEQNHDNRTIGLLNAQDLIAGGLPYRRAIETPYRYRGQAHLWSL